MGFRMSGRSAFIGQLSMVFDGITEPIWILKALIPDT